MADHDQYYEYLRRRSLLGIIYRRYWVFPRLARHLRGLTVDVGCGVGDMLRVRPGTIGVDINPRLVEYCRGLGLDARPMQPDTLPFRDASVDSVLLDNVIEHIADPAPLVGEIRRILKPQGILLVGIPGVRGWHSDPDHKVLYDQHNLRLRVEALGLVHQRTFFAPLFESDWMSRNLRQYFIYCLFVRPQETTIPP